MKRVSLVITVIIMSINITGCGSKEYVNYSQIEFSKTQSPVVDLTQNNTNNLEKIRNVKRYEKPISEEDMKDRGIAE